jgi:aspartate/methionine/tyrosine aminotransferase
MIIINNPNNPTGTAIPTDTLVSIVDLARERGIILLSDEVYRPLFHSVEPEDVPPSVLSLGYQKSIATSSMSKAWALAGIRVGWVASRDPTILGQITAARDYTTISVSKLDDQVSRYALCSGVRPNLLARNLNLARTNLALLEDFVRRHPGNVSWVKPTAATVAFIQVKKQGIPVDDVQFCKDLLAESKVMVVPGSKCFGDNQDFRGYVRVGYVSETETLQQALALMSAFILKYLT